jgi:hypothetical protein
VSGHSCMERRNGWTVFRNQLESSVARQNRKSGTWLAWWCTHIFLGQAERNMVGNKKTNNYVTS